METYHSMEEAKQTIPKSVDDPGDDDYVSTDVNDKCFMDTMTYNTHWLKGWSVFWHLKNSTWHNSSLWKMMGQLFILASLIAVTCYLVMDDTSKIDTMKFSEITDLLNIFVALMLTFFLSESVTRWTHCVDGFLMLFNSVRNLSTQFHALGTSPEYHKTAIRYGVLSAFFLLHELKRRCLSPHQQVISKQAMWEELRRIRRMPEHMQSRKYVTEKEQDILEPINDCAGQLWIWVASLIGHMAQTGEVPGMPSPTYGRILDLCQSAQDGVRIVRTAIVVKLPFIYMHTLATLIHVNNIIFAISLGLTVGSASSAIVKYARMCYYGTVTAQDAVPAASIQTILVQTLKCSAGPLLYQAAFDLGCSISAPFNDPDGAIPVSKMIVALQHDLDDQEMLSNNLPSWEKPCFKHQ